MYNLQGKAIVKTTGTYHDQQYLIKVQSFQINTLVDRDKLS